MSSWRRALDGSRSWGGFDIHTDRAGFTRYRLVVYPPGITAAERRWLRLHRGWPAWGSALWVVSVIALDSALGAWQALAIATGAAVSAGAVCAVHAGGTRRQVRSWAVVLMAGISDPATIAARDRLKRTVAPLTEADEGLAGGVLTPADHEAVWWRVYEEMATEPAVA